MAGCTGSEGHVDSDLCLHIGFLVAAAAALAFHAHLWCLSCEPQLVPVSGAHLGGALPSVDRRGRNPLFSCSQIQWSLPS